MSESKQSPRKVLAAQRRRAAMKMRANGATYATIGAKLEVSERRAWKMVQEGLQRLNDQMALDAEKLRRESVEMIDQILQGHLPRAVDGDSKSAQVCLRALDQKARLYSLVKVQAAQEGPTPVAKMSEEELRAEARRLGVHPPEDPPDGRFSTLAGRLPSSNGSGMTPGTSPADPRRW
jgi:hypothetical protein